MCARLVKTTGENGDGTDFEKNKTKQNKTKNKTKKRLFGSLGHKLVAREARSNLALT